jgi:hypothetical protein
MSIRCDISSYQVEALVSAGFIEPARDDATEVAMGLIRVLDCLTRSQQVPVYHDGL